MIEELELLQFHQEFVRIPSVSHKETEGANFVLGWLASKGVRTLRHGNNVIGYLSDSPKMLLNSHLDTVPPCVGWTRDPYDVQSIDGKVFGLGSNDAKGPASAMLFAFDAARRAGITDVAIMLVPEEETGGKGAEIAWPYVRDELGWNPMGVIVGEPTQMQIGASQSGLVVLDLIAKGTPCHSANAAPDGSTNPVFALARDLTRLKSSLESGDFSATIQPTFLVGSTARNQVPGEAKATLDIRTQPGTSHDELIDSLRNLFNGEIEVRSQRLKAHACPLESELIQSIQIALPSAKPYHSNTMSDLVFFDGVDAVKMGPGVSARSHSADEFILESELIEGAEGYFRVLQEVLR